ncbi:MAG: hypothetical protein HY902_15430 [Deltaproteobacteria bacterium]|nr:hypothetical protein [Deltaproteobacteria bacterium]
MSYRPPRQPPKPPNRAPLEPSERGDARLQAALAQARAADTYAAAATCEACTRERAASGDPEALCEDHLAVALGMRGGWAR